MKSLPVVLLLLFFAVMCTEGVAQDLDKKKMQKRNQFDRYGLIQRDSLGARLPPINAPDTLFRQNPCMNTMPIHRPDSVRNDMPQMKIPDSISYTMPTGKQVTSCWEQSFIQ